MEIQTQTPDQAEASFDIVARQDRTEADLAAWRGEGRRRQRGEGEAEETAHGDVGSEPDGPHGKTVPAGRARRDRRPRGPAWNARATAVATRRHTSRAPVRGERPTYGPERHDLNHFLRSPAPPRFAPTHGARPRRS